MKKMSEHLNEITRPSESVFSARPPLPEKLSLELNNTCNLNCEFCPFHSPHLPEHYKMKLSHMDPEMAKDILKRASELGIGRKELGLFATGEILLYEGFGEIIGYAKELGTFPYIYLTTNGVLADRDKIEEAVSAGVDSIRFSINAGNREDYLKLHGKDRFDTVIENLKNTSGYLKSLGRNINLSVSCVVTKRTEAEKDNIRSLLSEYVDDIVFMNAGFLEDISSEVKKEYAVTGDETENVIGDEYICGYIFNTMFIDSNGIVRLCCSSGKALVPMADLNKDPDLERAWYDPVFCGFRERLLTGRTKGTVCEKCIGRNMNKEMIQYWQR